MRYVKQSLNITRQEMEKRREDLFNRGDIGAMCWLLRSQRAQSWRQDSGKGGAAVVDIFAGETKWKDSGW